MLSILEMTLDPLKEEMNEAKKLKIKTSSAIEKRYGKGYRYEDEVKRNEVYKMVYSISKTLPVRVGSIIINYKLYQSFNRKLKGFETQVLLKGDCLELHYWKPFSKSKGILIFNDLTGYFNEFKHLPIARIENV